MFVFYIMNIHPPTLQGSYRLHVAPIQVQVDNNELLVLDIHFKIDYQKQQANNQAHKYIKPIKLIKEQQKPSARALSQLELLILDLFQDINGLQVEGWMLRFYGIGDKLIMRGKWQEGQPEPLKDNPNGKWDMSLSNLSLEVRDNKFQFQGIEKTDYCLPYTTQNEKDIKFEYNLPKQLNKKSISQKYDLIFIIAFLQSRTYKLGQVSFQMFDEHGKLTTRGLPYM